MTNEPINLRWKSVLSSQTESESQRFSPRNIEHHADKLTPVSSTAQYHDLDLKASPALT